MNNKEKIVKCAKQKQTIGIVEYICFHSFLLFASYRTSGENRRKIVFTSGYIYQQKSEQNTLNETDFLSFINKPGHSSQNMKSRHELWKTERLNDKKKRKNKTCEERVVIYVVMAAETMQNTNHTHCTLKYVQHIPSVTYSKA